MTLFPRISSRRFLSTFADLGAQMKQLNDRGQFRQAITLFERPDKKMNTLVVNQALKACIELGDWKRGEAIHKSLSSYYLNNSFIQTNLILKCGDMMKGEEIFRMSTNRTIPMVNHLLKGLVDHNRSVEALALFQQTNLEKNEYTFALLYKICAQLADRDSLEFGKITFNAMPKKFHANPVVLNSAFYMFIKCNDISMAEQVFIKMKDKNQITFGTMMNGFLSHGMPQRVLDLFSEIEQPTETIWTLLFNACAQLKTKTTLDFGEKVFSQIPTAYRQSKDLLYSALNMFIQCDDRTNAESVFPRIDRDVLACSSMMEFYNARKEPQKTWSLFERMKEKKVPTNEIVHLAVIAAVSSMGDLTLCQSVVSQIPPHLLTMCRMEVALIDMWGQVGSPDKGRDVFERMKETNSASYMAMIKAYALNKKGHAVVELFHRIPSNMSNSDMYLCILNACSDSALINEAKEIFEKIPINQRNERIYTTMIDAFLRANLFDQAAQIIEECETSHKSSSLMSMSNLSLPLNETTDSPLPQKNFKQRKSQSSSISNHVLVAQILRGNTCALSGNMIKVEQIRTEIARSGVKRVLGYSTTVVNGVITKFIVNDRSHPRSAEIYAEIDRWKSQLAELGYRPDPAWVIRRLSGNDTVESVLSAHSERLAIAFNLIQRPLPNYILFVNNLR